MAWASNWLYASKTPTHAFRGSFSLPRQLRLIETPTGLRVAASVPKGVSDRFEHFRLDDAPVRPRTGTYRLTGTISLQLGSAVQIALFGEATPQLTLERAPNGLVSLHLERAPLEGLRDFAHDYRVPVGALEAVDLEIFIDNGLVEIAIDRGRIWATNLHFPADVAGRIATTQIKAVSEAVTFP
jgi:sucrose-6-phosphate hydrolase SacC (GH32 family)